MTWLWSVPNFWRNLATTEHTLIHKEEMLPPLVGFQDPAKANRPTLPLPALLRRGERDLNTQHPPLYTKLFVQFTHSMH